ncbi:hypothetical protein RD792_006841, partial [Penstemon davidsonii]
DDGINVDNDVDNNVDSQTQHENMNNLENIDDANDDGDRVHGDGNGNVDNKANVKKPTNKRCEFWAYYTEEKVTINGVEVIKAKCIYCGVLIAAGGKRYGTIGLRNHYNAYGSPSYKEFVDKVTFGFEELFNEYKKIYGNATPTSPCAKSSGSTSIGFPEHDEFDCESELYDFDSQLERLRKGKEKVIKSELDKYLSEDCESLVDTFDILSWWKVETHRFPILSRMARDILVVPVSTVAIEATFSTGGRILDAFRSSLSPRIAQALICAQDWLRSDSQPINVEENLMELDSLEKDSIEFGVDSSMLDP